MYAKDLRTPHVHKAQCVSCFGVEQINKKLKIFIQETKRDNALQ